MWAALFLKMGQIGCPDASLTNYQPTFYNISEERRSQLHRGGKPETSQFVFGSRDGQKCAYRVFVVRPEIRSSLGDVGEDWRIILKRILNKEDGRVWTGFICIRLVANGIIL